MNRDLKNIKQPNLMDKYLSGELASQRKSIDTDKAWDKLKERMGREELIPDTSESHKKRSLYRFIAAASLILLIAASTLHIFISYSEKHTELVSILNTGGDKSIVKTLADGSIVYLADNASLTYPEIFLDDSRRVEMKGEAFFDIARNPQKPFIITVGNIDVEVLGTSFNIKSKDEKHFELIVTRGKVRVSQDGVNISSVSAGKKLIVDNGNTSLDDWQNDGSLAWHTNGLLFKDETLKNVAYVINKTFDTHILIPDINTANRKITVTFNNDSVDEMLQLICLSMNLKVEKKDATIVLVDKI